MLFLTLEEILDINCFYYIFSVISILSSTNTRYLIIVQNIEMLIIYSDMSKQTPSATVTAKSPRVEVKSNDNAWQRKQQQKKKGKAKGKW